MRGLDSSLLGQPPRRSPSRARLAGHGPCRDGRSALPGAVEIGWDRCGLGHRRRAALRSLMACAISRMRPGALFIGVAKFSKFGSACAVSSESVTLRTIWRVTWLWRRIQAIGLSTAKRWRRELLHGMQSVLSVISRTLLEPAQLPAPRAKHVRPPTSKAGASITDKTY